MTIQDGNLVVIVGSLPFYDSVEATLRDEGHAVRRYQSAAEFAADGDALDGATILYTLGSTPVTRERMERSPQLRAVVSPVVGIEDFDMAAATELGVAIGNGAIPENYISMAEATIMLILACLYDLPGKAAALAEGRPYRVVDARMLRGKTLGLFGFGNIARTVAERLEAWDVTILATARRTPADAPANVSFVLLDDLLDRSDVFCMLAPLNADTNGVLDARRLAMTKPGSCFVGISRGGIVDERALYDLARDGHFSRVALDVFGCEPLPLDSPLRGLDNVILTPHVIGHSMESVERVPEIGLENLRNIMSGRLPVNLCNPLVENRWHQRFGGS